MATEVNIPGPASDTIKEECVQKENQVTTTLLDKFLHEEKFKDHAGTDLPQTEGETLSETLSTGEQHHDSNIVSREEKPLEINATKQTSEEVIQNNEGETSQVNDDQSVQTQGDMSINQTETIASEEGPDDQKNPKEEKDCHEDRTPTETTTDVILNRDEELITSEIKENVKGDEAVTMPGDSEMLLENPMTEAVTAHSNVKVKDETNESIAQVNDSQMDEHSEKESKKLENDTSDSQLTLVLETVTEVGELKKPECSEIETSELDLGKTDLEAEKIVESSNEAPEAKDASGLGKETGSSALLCQSLMADPQGIHDDKADDRTVDGAEEKVETLEVQAKIDSDEKIIEDELSKGLQVNEEHSKEEISNSSYSVVESMETADGTESTLTHEIKDEVENLRRSENFEYEEDSESTLQKEDLHVKEQLKSSNLELDDDKKVIVDQNAETSANDQAKDPKVTPGDEAKENSVDLAETKEETCELENAATNEMNTLKQVVESQMKDEEPIEKEIGELSLTEAVTLKAIDAEALITQDTHTGDDQLRESQYGNNEKKEESTLQEKEIINPIQEEDAKSFDLSAGSEQSCSTEKLISTSDAQAIMTSETNDSPGKELTPEVDGTLMKQEKQLEKETENPSLNEASDKETNDVEASVVHDCQIDDESLRQVENCDGEKYNQIVLPKNEDDVPSAETNEDLYSTNKITPTENEPSSSTTEDKENQKGDGEERTPGHSELPLENLVNKTMIEVEEPKEAAFGESEESEVNLGNIESEENKTTKSLNVDSENIEVSGSGQETELCSVNDQSSPSDAQEIVDDKAVHEAEQNVETLEFKELIDFDEKTEERLNNSEVKEEHLSDENQTSSNLVEDSIVTTNEEISLPTEETQIEGPVKFSLVEGEDTETRIVDRNTELGTEDLSENAKGTPANNEKENSIDLADTMKETPEIASANDVNALSEMDDSQMKHEENAEKDTERESLTEALIEKGNDEEPLIMNESQNGDEHLRESENLKNETNVESTPEPEDNNVSASSEGCSAEEQIVESTPEPEDNNVSASSEGCSAEEQIVVNKANDESCDELIPEVDVSQVRPEKSIEKETEIPSLSEATTKESNEVEALVIHENQMSENPKQAECSNNDKGIQIVELNKETEDSNQQFPLVEEKTRALIEEVSHVFTEEQNLTVDTQAIIDNEAKDAEEEALEVKNLTVDTQAIIDNEAKDAEEEALEVKNLTVDSQAIIGEKANDAEDQALESVAETIPHGVTEDSIQIKEIIQEPNIQDEDLIKTVLLESEKIQESYLVKKPAEEENTSGSNRVASDDVRTSAGDLQTETSVIKDQVHTENPQENSCDATETKTNDSTDSKEETLKDVFTTDMSDRDSECSSQKVDSLAMKNEENMEKDFENPNNCDDESTITNVAEQVDAKLLQADSSISENSTSISVMESYIRSSPEATEEIKTFSTHQDIEPCLEDQNQTEKPEVIKEDQEEHKMDEIEVTEETADAKQNDLTNVSNEGSQVSSMTVAEGSCNTSEEQSPLEVSIENEDDETRSPEKSSDIKDNEICSEKEEDKDGKQDTIVTFDGEKAEKKGETTSEPKSSKEIVPENGVNEIVDIESKKKLEQETSEEVLESIVQFHSGNTILELQGMEAEESLKEIAPEIKSKDIVATENLESKEITDEAKDTIKDEIEKMKKVEEDTENQLYSSSKEEVILESQLEDEITKKEEIAIAEMKEIGKIENEKGSKDFIETDDKTAGQTEESSPANEATDTSFSEKEQGISVKKVYNELETEEEARSLVKQESMKVNDTGSNTEDNEIIEQELKIVPEIADQAQSCEMVLKEEQAQTEEDAPMGKNSDVIEPKEPMYEPDEQMGTENSTGKIEETESDTGVCYHNNSKEEQITETQSTNQSQQNNKVPEVSEEADIKVADDEEKAIVTDELVNCMPSLMDQENKDIPEAEELWKDIKSIDQIQTSDVISKGEEEDTTKKGEPANTAVELKPEDIKTEDKFEPKETTHEEQDIAKIDILNEKKERDEEVEDQLGSGNHEPYITSKAEFVETKVKTLEETTEPELDSLSSMIKQSKEGDLHHCDLRKEEVTTDIQLKDEVLKICEESEDKVSEVTENNLETNKLSDEAHNKESTVEEVISTIDTQEQAPSAHHGYVKNKFDDMISSNVETKAILEPKDMDSDVETITEVQSCEIISKTNEVSAEEDKFESVEDNITADKNPVGEGLDAAKATKEEAENTEVRISSDKTKEEDGDMGGHHLDSCKKEIDSESKQEEDVEEANTNKKLSQPYEEPNNSVESLAVNSCEIESTTLHLSEQVKNIDVATLAETTEEPHYVEQQQEKDPISDLEARILDCKEQDTVSTAGNVLEQNKHTLAEETTQQYERSMKDALQSDSLPDIKCLDVNKVDNDAPLASVEFKSTDATKEEETLTPTQAKHVLEEYCTENPKPEISVGNKVMTALQHEASVECSDGQCEAAQPFNLEVEKPDKNDPAVHSKDVHAKDQNDAEEPEDANTDDEKDNKEEPAEHVKYSSGPDAPVMVDAGDVDVKASHKKSHHLLSGVGSKVKHSIAKVKKAITGKSSHPKTPS